MLDEVSNSRRAEKMNAMKNNTFSTDSVHNNSNRKQTLRIGSLPAHGNNVGSLFSDKQGEVEIVGQ